MADALDLDVNAFEQLEDLLQSGAVIRQLDRGLGLGTTMLAMADERPIDSDALGVALGKHLTSLGVEQLVFKR